ncbi:MAG: 50S ribosomal protein L21 [Victivallales bacterium]|nr:50S ribosomal protein L21 [Victivallales bacterium]
MYAIIKTSGKQYKVEPGQDFDIDRIEGDQGAAVEFGDVLAIVKDDNATVFGTPTIAGAKVTAEIKMHFRGPKLIVFKMKRRKRSRRKNGHRQDLTRVTVKEIVGA